MVLVWPLSLLGLVLTAAVAAWALLRPSRQLAVVGTLDLWQKALDALDRSAGRSSRRVNASWVLLLAGSAVAVLALARPVVNTHGQGRVVSLAVCPSAELGDQVGGGELRRAAKTLLGRLDPADRVEMLLPPMVGGGTPGLLLPWEASQRIADLPILPIPAAELTVPDARGDSQHTYWLVPVGRAVPSGPRTTVIELATDAPAVTVEAVGAADVPPRTPVAAREVELFIALRNHSLGPTKQRVVVMTLPPGGGAPARAGGKWAILT